MAGPEQDPGAEIAAVAPAAADRLVRRAHDYARAARADSTLRAYAHDWDDFAAWCAGQHPTPSALPATPATVALYLADLAATRRPATLRRRLAAISVVHQLAGHPSPTGDAGVRAVWAGIRRTHHTAPRKVRALRTRDIALITAGLGDGLADARDRALLLLGFAGALRRSELVALDVADIEDDRAGQDAGLRVRVRSSKTDTEGAGAVIGVPYGSSPDTCPVRAWRAWLSRSGLATGPAFRGVDRHGRLAGTRLSDRAVADMIKRRAAAAGLAGDVSGHSLRAGFATEGYAQGVPELAIMRHGRWTSAAVMRGYVQDGSLWIDNAAGRLGL